MPTNFLTLKEILAELKGKNSITVLRKYCQDEWEFYDLLRDLMNNEDFNQACIDKSFNESCQKDFDHYIELANQAKKAVSKYFERKDIELQAYYTETNDADRILNINLANHDGNEPIRISDILQQEKNISKLNVYCDKKHDIYAYRKNKKRYYEFKEGAYYEMISTWPATDKSGKTFMCTMVMNVSSDGITEILKFDGRDFESPSREFWELIGLNKELYIQGLSLYDAVKALLERNKNAPLPDVVPTADNDSRNSEPIRSNQDKEIEKQEVHPGHDADNNPISPTNSDASTQTEVDSRQVATQQEIKELNKQRDDLQRELERAKQAIEAQEKKIENLQVEKNKIHEESREEVEKLNEKIEAMKQKIEWLERGSSNLQSELEKEKQKNVELEKYNNDLQNEFRKEGQKNIELQANLTQKNEELASISANLQEKTQELENMRGEKEELISKLKELQKELNQLKEKNYKLEDENDQLECSNKKLEKEKEQLLQKILGLEEAQLSLEGEKQALSDRLSNSVEKRIKSKQELIKARQEIEKLGEENSSLQAEYKEEKQKLKKEMGKIYEKIIQLNAEQEQKDQELHEKNKELEEKLKFVNAQNKKLKDELEKSKRAEQQTYEDAELEISENHKTMQGLHAQLQKLKQENQEVEKHYICTIEKLAYEIEDLKPELENERKTRKKYHMLLEEQDIEINDLKKIIEDKVQEVENLKGELQNKKEGEIFRNQTKALGKDIHLLASKQIDLNQAYTITADVLNDPDNVPLKKRKLSRSLSIDNGYDSGKESYNNRCHSPLSLVSNPVQVNSAYTGQSERSNYGSVYS
ncbi:MAG: Chromosome partition protein Smc [Wolbachia endosymbiont of Ctenocephalides felis wCfeF]|nr:MAG: Chromosome partition protein Smc [Wolbachia endosymbiont of Ctenocephalides felis wCfeF]